MVGIFDPRSLTIYEMDPSATQSFSSSTSTSQASVMGDFAQSSTMASSNEILFADTFIRQSGVDQSSDATPSLTDAILETDSFLVSSKNLLENVAKMFVQGLSSCFDTFIDQSDFRAKRYHHSGWLSECHVITHEGPQNPAT